MGDGWLWADYHTLDSWCTKTWCRLHWWPVPSKDEGVAHVPYPIVMSMKTSSYGWVRVTVHHGPGAYLPKKPR